MDHACNRPPAKCWVKDFILPVSIMPQTFIEDSGNLKNVKSINNTSASHLVSCCVIPRPATEKGLKKDVFWKIRALENLKCNKSNYLKSK